MLEWMRYADAASFITSFFIDITSSFNIFIFIEIESYAQLIFIVTNDY